MATAFFVWPQKGHIYPTLFLARKLQSLGSKVVYFGHESGQSIVEQQGFKYVVFPNADNLRHAKTAKHSKTEYNEVLFAEFGLILEMEKVAQLFVDPLICAAALAGLRKGIPTAYFWVFNPPYLRRRHLPFLKSYTLARSILARRLPAILWLPVWSLHRWETFKECLLEKDGPKPWLLKESKRNGLRVTYTSYGLRPDLPAIVLGPIELSHCEDPNVQYLGLGVDRARQETTAKLKPARKYICCSFGGNVDIYRNAVRALEQIMQAAAEMRDYEFHIHSSSWTKPIPENVRLHNNIPMLELLGSASAAIIHGGYGMLKECIATDTPSLIIPFQFDQPTNAYRAVTAGTSLVLSPRTCTSGEIVRHLRRLTQESQFSTAIRNLRKRMLETDTYDTFSKMIALRDCMSGVGDAQSSE